MIEIGKDFQGWPLKAHTLREILLRLGFEEDSETITLIKGEGTNELLDSYPCLLEDDGMGYGVNQEYIVEVDDDVYDNEIADKNVKSFNIFREKVFMEDVLKLRKEREEFDKNFKGYK